MSCIRTNVGRRTAICGREVNIMSWKLSDDPCPES